MNTFAARAKAKCRRRNGLAALAISGLLLQTQAEDQSARQSSFIGSLCQVQPGVAVVEKLDSQSVSGDWLIRAPDRSVQLQVEPAVDGQSARLALCNGLVSRTFYVGANLACFSYRNLRSRAEFIRAVKPEMRLKLDNQCPPPCRSRLSQCPNRPPAPDACTGLH